MNRDFWADYRKTPRNAPSGRAFADIGLDEIELRDGVTSLVFRKDRSLPAFDFITITDQHVRSEVALNASS
jgi:hypothetical protein